MRISDWSSDVCSSDLERSLNIDFLLGWLKRILPQRPDLKVIVTSATLDPEKLSKHFNDAPILFVSGRTYPVEQRYRPLADDGDQEGAIASARSEEHTSELQSLMRTPYAVLCLKKK